MTLQDILKSKKSEVEKMCLVKGIPLTRPVVKVIRVNEECEGQRGRRGSTRVMGVNEVNRGQQG